MKNQFISPKVGVLALFCCMFVFYGCRKEPDVPPPDLPPLDIPWLLTGVHAYYYDYPPQDRYEEMQHSFQYNAFNQISVHKMLRGIYDTGEKYDSFFYDAHQRIVEIRSGWHFVRGSRVHKQTFQYDAYGRKQRAFKYFLDTTIHQYRMADSTVYVYQDPTIIRITYHLWNPYNISTDPLPGTIDTSSFTYNQEGNLVKASLKYGRWYGAANREYTFTQYDSTPNPYRLLGVQGLELDPQSESEWDDITGDDFTLQMQVPKFSKNNYRTKTNTTFKSPYTQHYKTTYGGADDNMIQSIIFYYEDPDHSFPDYGYEYGQEFTYTPR